MNKQHYKREPNFSVYELSLNNEKIALRDESSFWFYQNYHSTQITQTDIKILYFIIAFLRISLSNGPHKK